MYNLYNLCHVFVILLSLYITAPWSPGGKRLAPWLLFPILNLEKGWYLIASIPDAYCLAYFYGPVSLTMGHLS